MPGITDQLNKYKSAVGTRNEGSAPSSAEKNKAANTSIGRTRGSMVSSGRSTGKTKQISKSATRTNRPRGSWEGYQHAPRTLLAMNGTGFYNKANQKARYKQKGTQIDMQKSASLDFKSNNNRIVDHRFSGLTKNNSVQKLKNITKSDF